MTPTKLVFPLPPGRNAQERAARSGWRVGSAMKKEWTAKCMNCVPPGMRFDLPVRVSWKFFVPSFRGDFDNYIACLKPILDGMVKSGAIAKDNLTAFEVDGRVEVGFSFERSKEPRIECYIESIR